MSSKLAILVGSFHTHVQVLEFQAESRSLALHTILEPAFEGHTWIQPSPVHACIFYVVQSIPKESGILSVIHVQSDANQAYRLEVLQSVPSGGQDPCHIGISDTGTSLAIANVSPPRRPNFVLLG